MSHSSSITLLPGCRATVWLFRIGLGQSIANVKSTLESQVSHQEMMVRQGALQAVWKKKSYANESLPTKT